MSPFLHTVFLYCLTFCNCEFKACLSDSLLITTDSPWVYSLNTLQYEQLFDVSPQMEEVIGEELNITFLRFLVYYHQKIYPLLILSILL